MHRGVRPRHGLEHQALVGAAVPARAVDIEHRRAGAVHLRMGDRRHCPRQQRAVGRAEARHQVVARPGVVAVARRRYLLVVAGVGAAQGERRGVAAQRHVVVAAGRDGRGDVEEVVGVAEVGQALIVEDGVDLRGERGPQRRRRAGPAVGAQARHGRPGNHVVHVAAGVCRDVRDAASGQSRGIRCPGVEAERPLVPGRGPAGIDAARARVVVHIAGLVTAGRRNGRAGDVVVVPHRLDQERGEVGRIGHVRQAAGHELPDRRAIVRHRLRDDVGQRRVGQRRFDGAVGRAAHHEGIGAGPAGADVGQAVAVLVARAAVAGALNTVMLRSAASMKSSLAAK